MNRFSSVRKEEGRCISGGRNIMVKEVRMNMIEMMLYSEMHRKRNLIKEVFISGRDKFMKYLQEQEADTFTMGNRDDIDTWIYLDAIRFYLGDESVPIEERRKVLSDLGHPLSDIMVSEDTCDERQVVQHVTYGMPVGSNVEALDKLNTSFMPVSIEDALHDMVKFELGHVRMDTDPVYTKAVKRIKQKIADYVINYIFPEHTEHFSHDDPGEAMFCFLLQMDKKMDGTGLPYLYDFLRCCISDYMQLEYMLGSLQLGFHFKGHAEELIPIYNRVIDEYAKSCVLRYLAEYHYQDLKMNNADRKEMICESVRNRLQTAITSQQVDLSAYQFRINRQIRATEDRVYFETVLGWIITATTKYALKPQVMQYVQNGKIDGDMFNRINKKAFSRYKQKLGEKDKEIKRLKEQIERQKKQNSKQTHPDAEKIKILEKENGAIRAVVSKKDKNIAYLSDENRELRQRLRDLEQRLAEVTTIQSIPDMSEPVIDDSVYEGRYMFVCLHEPLCKKILERFSNSVMSYGKQIDAKNADKIEAVIYITKDISHHEYYRVKAMCQNYAVPQINCNTVNLDSIAQSISAWKKEAGHEYDVCEEC